jgi:hypothetical protein
MNRPCIRLFLPMVLAVSAAASAQTSGDSVEFISGQVLHGTVTDPTFTLVSGMGTIAVPIDRVSSLVCQPPPLVGQSLQMRDGDELVGWMSAKSLHWTDDEGKAVDLPLGQISRVMIGFRPMSAPPTTLPGVVATVYGLAGDHFQVILPPTIEFRSRWGTLTPDAQHIQQLVLADKNQAAHRLFLSDGSELSGIASAPTLALTPVDAPGSPLAAPVGEIAKLVCNSPEKPPAKSPKMEMIGGDVLRGAPQGTLTVQTQFGDISVKAGEIQKLATEADSPGDLAMTLTDGRVVRAAAPQTAVTCKLAGGLTLDVPAGMIASYARSAAAGADATPPADGPAVDPATADQVQKLVKQLANQNNNALRVRTQTQLVAMGKPILSLLADLRPDQLPRVQRQIDNIVDRINAGDQ